jgi:hypothetical protein
MQASIVVIKGWLHRTSYNKMWYEQSAHKTGVMTSAYSILHVAFLYGFNKRRSFLKCEESGSFKDLSELVEDSTQYC